MRTFRVARGIYSLVYAPNAPGLWVGDESGRVHFLDLASGEVRRAFQVPPGHYGSAVYSLSVSADGNFVAASSYARVALYDALAEELAEPQPPTETGSYRSMLAPNGELLAAVNSDGLILWNRQCQQVQSIDPSAGDRSAGSPDTVCFAPDSLRLVLGIRLGQKLVIYDAQSGAQVGRELEGGAYVEESALAFSPDGKQVAAGVINQVHLWDVESRRRRLVIKAGQAIVRRLAYHPGGRILATAGDTPSVSLWSTTDGRLLGRYDWKISKVQAVAFAPDGMTVAAGGSGGKVAVWDMEDVS